MRLILSVGISINPKNAQTLTRMMLITSISIKVQILLTVIASDENKEKQPLKNKDSNNSVSFFINL
jgi:hypothetical protein